MIWIAGVKGNRVGLGANGDCQRGVRAIQAVRGSASPLLNGTIKII